MDSWDQSLRIAGVSPYLSCTWSPCGQFIAAAFDGGVEIRDALSSELVCTLAEAGGFNYPPDGPSLAYSPDGRSFAYLSGALIISDIQTGGAAAKIEYGLPNDGPIVWSLDGRTIGTVVRGDGYSVRVYDVASDTVQSPGKLHSGHKPHLWAHDNSFRIMATRWDGWSTTIEIFEVGFNLTKIESFHPDPPPDHGEIIFSPATYRISVLEFNWVCITDVRNPECLLVQYDHFEVQRFSFDGNLFGASLKNTVCIWKWDPRSHTYTPWREFQIQGTFQGTSPLISFPFHFSPTSSSIVCGSQGVLRVYRLDSPGTVAHPDCDAPLAILSPCGTYVATVKNGGRTVAITNSLSQTTSRLIDMGKEIRHFAFTGNILLVNTGCQITAWRLTEEGLVDGVFGVRRAILGDNLWEVSGPCKKFTFTGQIGIVGNSNLHAYHTGTGEVLEPAQTLTHSHSRWYHEYEMYLGRHYPHYHGLNQQGVPSKGNWPVSQYTLRGGWLKDPEGEHRLWIPIEWRAPKSSGWFSNITALRLDI